MAQRSRWWTRSRGLPAETYAAWRSSVLSLSGPQARVLAWAATADGYCVGSPAVLSSGSEAGWTHIGWHQIETGGWDRETGRLTWTLYGGERGSVALSQPGRLPELFRERVAASIVLEKFIPVLNQRGVLVSGRRDLSATDGPITWNTTLGRGLSWQGEGVRAAAEAAVASVRAEYDLG